MSATRPWVNAFADEMERKLDLNRHKGDRAGWSKETAGWLVERLNIEVGELSHAICDAKEGREKIILSECADVANFAMMIADVAGGLKPKP